MKIAVYLYKENNKVRNVDELTEKVYEMAFEKVEKFNENEKNDLICELYDTEKHTIPSNVLEYVFKIAVKRKQINLSDILEKLSDLEDTLDDLRCDFDNIKDDIKEFLEKEDD